MGGPIRKRIVARGRVQGVFFRDTVRRRAESIGVGGWVTNRDDGAVVAFFEGEPDAVDSMVRFCEQGPGHAEVTELELSSGEEPEGLSDFRIK